MASIVPSALSRFHIRPLIEGHRTLRVRACTIRKTDLWGFVVDEVSGGDNRGRALLTPPAWTGEVPTVVDRVVRGESDFVQSEVSIRMHEPGDLWQVSSIQEKFVLKPLRTTYGVSELRRSCADTNGDYFGRALGALRSAPTQLFNSR